MVSTYVTSSIVYTCAVLITYTIPDFLACSALDEQANSDIEGVVTKISLRISDVETERLQLVAETIAEKNLDGIDALVIYHEISNKYERLGQAKIAATLFREALICATSTDEVNDRFGYLNDFCDPECLKKETELLGTLKWRQSLLEFGDTELNQGGMQLKTFVEEFKDDELGTSRDKITTPTKLFRCLLRKKVLPPKSPTEWITILETRLPRKSGTELCVNCLGYSMDTIIIMA